ncbi:MAG: ABC transporter permease [Gammaproteobacteria bacterium]
MNNITLTIARWEFFRFFKWRTEIITLVFTSLLLTAGYLGKPLMEWVRGSNVSTLAIVGDVPYPEAFDALPVTVTQWPRDASVDEALAALAADELDGVAIWDVEEQAMVLTVMQTPSWQAQFEAAASRQAVAARLDQSTLTPEEFAAITAPASTRVDRHVDASPEPGKLQKILGVVAVLLPLMGVFAAFSYFFVSITAEKQNRLGEQLLSAVGARRWLDGKLIGLTALSLKSIFTTGLLLSVVLLVVQKFSGTPMDFGPINAGSVIMAFGFCILAVAFWSTVLAAAASTISDPNSSTRGGLMMLPAVFMMLPFAATDAPDAPGAVALSIAPITNTAFMPMRLALSDVPLWQVLLSVAVIIFSIAVMRWVAQRVLKMAMLMYGQEPTYAEIWQMLRRSV